LRLELHPSIRRLDLDWNVTQFWQAVDEEHDNIAAPERSEQTVPWVIYRKDLKQYFRSLEIAEAWALDQALTGHSFAEICEGLLQWKSENEAAGYAAQLLQGWISDHMVVALN